MPGKKYYFWRKRGRRKYDGIRIFIVVIFSIFFLRLVELQLLKGDYYWKLAEQNRVRYFRISAPRGRIFDRNGIELAGTTPAYSVVVSPEHLSRREKENISNIIGKITGHSEKEIMTRLYSERREPFGVISIASYLTKEEIIQIMENLHYIPQVFIQTNPVRKYNYGNKTSHLLGYTGAMAREEYIRLRQLGYTIRDRIGKTGIEKAYDSLLRGIDGFQEIETGPAGEHREVLSTKDPERGNDLLLTIDWNLQNTAAEVMGSRAGSVVAMDPNTGEILVWLSKPGYDPDLFLKPKTTEEVREIFEDERLPFFNRILQGQYPPGSLMKPAVAAAAVEYAGLTEETRYDCKGFIEVGRDERIFRCWEEREHGEINMLDAVAESCNVYFYRLGLDIGGRKIKEAAELLGLGRRSQNIFMNERMGVVPDPEWKRANIGSGWFHGDTVNLSVGQGYIGVNPMQVLRMYAAIASRGKVFEPHLVKIAVSPEGEIMHRREPNLEGQIGFSDYTFAILGESMRRAVEFGTARFLNLPLEVAAKTGTAQTSAGEDHAWFACYAPFNDPEIVIVVMVEHAGYGAVEALPVARAILQQAFKEKM